MKTSLRSPLFAPTLGTFLLVAVLPALRAQTLTSIDFESFTPGPGHLTDGGAFTSYAFSGGGTLTPSASHLVGDKLQGVTTSGGSQVGYLGGAGTDLTFTGSGALGAGLFPGSGSAATTNYRGSSQSVMTLNLDFSVNRVSNANQQNFSIYFYDAQDASDTNTFAYHSYINIAADNHVYIQDYYFNNISSAWIDTGVVITSGDKYHATLSVDYNASTWSASLSNLTVPATFTLATNRSTNGGAYTLSGWNDVDGGIDISMWANTVSDANKGFADSIRFDNLTITAVPEPSTYALLAGVGALGFALWRRRRGPALARGLLVCCLSFFGLASLPAQTVVLSNLGSTTLASAQATTSNYVAQAFTTDSSSYLVDSVTLRMNNALDTGGNFFVKIVTGDTTPLDDIGSGGFASTLTGTANPATSGTYTFTTSSLMLQADTTYWLMIGVSSGTGNYRWYFPNSTTFQTNTWDIGTAAQSANSGSSWTLQPTFNPYMFSITATAVPEPSTYAALAGLAALGLAGWRRYRAAKTRI